MKRTYSPEFKVKVARLVIGDDYTLTAACKEFGVGATALRRWVKQLRAEEAGESLAGHKPITPDQQRIRELEAKIHRIERDNEILKKATALLMSDEMRSSR